MSDVKKENTNYVGYEHKKVNIRKETEGLWSDSMTNFGWKLEKSEPALVKRLWAPLCIMLAPLAVFPGTPFGKLIRDHKSETHIELTFKRDKNIPRKTELSRLQSQFEAQTNAIESLEDSKSSSATTAAYIVALIGAAFMAASVFTLLGSMLPLSIIMAVPGFACWILPYFIYRSMKDSKTRKVGPQIEKQYDNIYDVCKKANELLRSGVPSRA